VPNKVRRACHPAIAHAFLITIFVTLCSTTGVSQGHLESNQTSEKHPHPDSVYFNAAGRKAIQPGVLPGDRFSATSIGDVLTLLFDSAKVDLQTQNDSLVGAWLGTVRVPINAGTKARTSYLQHLRGSVNKTEDTRVVVVVDVGGKTFTSEFPYGGTRNGNFLRQFVSPILKKSNAYTATVLIVAERRAAVGAVLVQVDGLDVEAKSGAKKKNR
jgi:hypothetical protein